jgi:PAS domain S-box-containing protein
LGTEGRYARHPESPYTAQLLEEDAVELYEHAPCGYLSTLPDGTIIKVNATFLEWTGYGRDQLVGRTRFQSLLPVVGQIFYDTHLGPLLLMQGFAKELAFEIVCHDGSRIPIILNTSLKRDRQGQPLVIRTTILDARGRRAYEEELRLSKRRAEEAEAETRRLNEVLEERVEQRTQERDRIWRMSQDMLVVATIEGKLISFNPAFSRILGWTEQESDGIQFGDLVHPEHHKAFNSALETLASGQSIERFETRARHKNSKYRWISWTGVPEESMVYAVGRDVTAEKEQADLLRKTEEALVHAQKMEAIGKLTGGIAHDFNNILQVIAGNLELLKLDFEGAPQAIHRLQVAIGAVGRGAKLASQLLSFARRQPLKPLPSNIGRILREMDDMLRRALGESVELEVVASAGLWTTLVDRNQLENVVLNLAINARDAMNATGKMTLEVSNAMLDDRCAETHPEAVPGQYVMLAISDTGCGMPPEVMEHIFEPFFTTKPEGSGTGLGLSMAYGFVKQSGGHIKVYSEPGHGTTFKIYLPRVHQAETVVSDTPVDISTGGSETILVVEDDPAVQETVVATLAGLGYRVLKAHDGESALAHLRSGAHVDLLFTDAVMPGPVKSTELARLAKTLLPEIEILFTSGYTQNVIAHGGRLDPGVELISKPYSRNELAKKIRRMLPNTRKSIPATTEPQKYPIKEKTPLSQGSLRVLVVEDNDDANDMLCELIRLLGHDVQGVPNAEVAIDILRTNPSDILLTDMRLPGMSGLDLAKQALSLRPDIHIIFSSGFGAIESVGFNSLSLPKPYDLAQIEDIFQKIRRQVPRQ